MAVGKELGVDLGTSSTLIYLRGKGIIMKAPSVVAIDKAGRGVIAVGSEAKRMVGKTPAGIVAHAPVKNGVIADFEVTSLMLHQFFTKLEVTSLFSRPSVVASTPYGATEVEKRAVEDAFYEAGARHVALIDEPLPAAIGAGVRIGGARGHMVVDIGAGTTEVSVISLGGIVSSHVLRVAGEELDEAIIHYLKATQNILIGAVSAERLKMTVGSAHPTADRGSMEVSGRNIRSGRAMSTTVGSGEVREAIGEELRMIAGVIKEALERTPPELSADIYDYGILLTGGMAHLPGLATFIEERTRVRVNLAPRPLESVCLGIGRIVESSSSMEDVLRYRSR